MYYNEIDAIYGSYTPSMVQVDSGSYRFWERALFQRLASVIKITKMPEEWRGSVEDFFKFVLFRRGFLAVLNTAEYGDVFQPCAFGGERSLYYQPTTVLITNPYWKVSQTEFKIGEECELLKLTPDYIGVWDIVDYYARKLATLNGAIDMATINSKFAYMLTGRNKAAREALKKGFDKINSGQPFVIFDTSVIKDTRDKEESIFMIDRKVKESYILTDLLKDFNTIIKQFDAEIGIPVIPYDKPERENVAESNIKQVDSCARATTWLKCLKSSCEAINAHYGDLLDFELSYIDEERSGNYANNGTELDADNSL